MQAQDRAHRLGQKKEVKVYRLLTENTIEHYVFKTALKKSQLSGAILDNTDEHWQIGEEEIGSARAMLTIGEEQWTRNEQEDDASYHIVATTKLENEGVILDEGDVSDDSWDDTPQTDTKDNTWKMGETIGTEDVELDEEWVKLAEGDRSAKQLIESDNDLEVEEEKIAVPRRNRRKRRAVGFVEDNESEENEDIHVEGMQESQFVEEEILDCDRAGRQLVMFSTLMDKKNEQVMGDERVEGGGIENGNVDDAKWVAPPATQAVSDEEEEEEEEEVTMRRSKRGQRRKEVPKVNELIQLDCSADEEESVNRIVPAIESSTDDDIEVVRNEVKPMPVPATLSRKRQTPDPVDTYKQQTKKAIGSKVQEKRKLKKYEDPGGKLKSSFAARARVRRM